MKKIGRELLIVILVLLATFGVVAGVYLYRKQGMQGRIELLARAPEKGNWFPQELKVKKDKEVVLFIRNIDTVSHGFYLPAFEIMEREIKAGEIKEVRFLAKKTGEFPFYCALWCGDNHMHMQGRLVVE